MVKKPLYFIGFGDFACELLADWEGFNLAQTHFFAGFFDDDPTKASELNFKGTVSQVCNLPRHTSVLLTAASPEFRKKWANACPDLLDYPNLIHQHSRLGESVTLGKGNIISEGCILTTNIEMGNFNMLNHYVTIGHHAKIGHGNAFMTKAHLSGHVTVGSYNLLAVGSSILQGKSMGDHNTLGPHACLMNPVGDGKTYMGTPALAVK
jgi:serine acetyltransferase